MPVIYMTVLDYPHACGHNCLFGLFLTPVYNTGAYKQPVFLKPGRSIGAESNNNIGDYVGKDNIVAFTAYLFPQYLSRLKHYRPLP
jgi:hypothetical protein